MSDTFDAVDYFNRRTQALDQQNQLNPVEDKFQATQKAAERASQALQQSGYRKQDELAAAAIRNKDSLVNLVGANPDSIVGGAVNSAAHLLAGASSQVVAPLLALPSDLRAAYKSMGMDDEDLAAYARYMNKQSTTEDRARLNQFTTVTSPSGTVLPDSTGGSKLDKLIEADKSREIAKTTRDAFNIDYLKQDTSTQKLDTQIGAGFADPAAQISKGFDDLQKKPEFTAGMSDMAAGLGKLIANAGAAAKENPAGVGLHVMENLPQLLAGVGRGGAAALTATNVGYATNEYNKGIEKYRSENGGNFPPEDKRLEMAAWAASLALSEQVGDLTELKLIAPSATKGLLKSVAGTVTSAAQATGSEALTEGYQTFAEGKANLTPVTGEQIYTGAVIGGLVGGHTTGALHGVSELSKPTEKAAATQTRQEALQGAVATGDVTALTDKKSATYAPEQAIAALAGHSAQPTTSDEAKQANLEKASGIVADLHTEKASLEKSLSEIDIPAMEARLAEVKAQKGSPELINALEESLREDPKAKKTLELQLSKVNRRIEQSNEHFTRLNTGLKAAETQGQDVEAQIQELSTKVDAADSTQVEVRQQQADSIINLSMAIPERLKSEDALALADNADNGLSDPQRKYLRAFSAARVAENTAKSQKGVAQEVLFGGNGNVGISQHRDRVAAALAAGNQKLADQHLATLQTFQSNHLGKAAAVEKAWSLGKGTQVVRTKSGLWIASPTLRPRAELRQNGGLEVNTPALVNSIRTEATAITAAQTELKAAYAVKFSSKPKGGTNVTHVPESHGVPDSKAKPTAGKEASAVGSTSAPAAGPADRAGDGSRSDGGVEAPRVEPTEDERLAGKKALFKHFKDLGSPDDVNASRVASAQKKANDAGVPQTVWLSPSGTTGIVAQGQQSPLKDATVLATIYPEPAASLAPGDAQTVSAEPVSSSTQASPDAVKTADAKGSKQSTESTAATSTVSVTPSESAEQTREESHGKLAVMSTKSTEGTAFNLRNLIADYFTQSEGKEADATKRPLASVKDFLSSSWQDVKSFLPFADLTEGQTGALAFFKTSATKWSETIQKNLDRRVQKPGQQDPRTFWFEDLMQFFIVEGADSKLDLEENVKTAMAYAAFSWVAENATRPMGNTDAEINVILGRDETETVEEHERRALKYVGTRQNVVSNALGQRVIQALGLKANKDAPVDLMPKLEGAFGAHVFKMLMDQGILQRTTVSAEVMATLTGSTATDKDAAHLFLRLARDSDNKLTDKAEEIFKKSTGTQSVIDKLFGVEPGLKEPTNEPVPFTQKKTRNTDQNVPSTLAEILTKENAGASFIRGEMYDLVQHLDEDLVLEMAGGEEVSVEKVHKANRPGKEAKSEGLLRELQNIKAYVTGLLKQDETLEQPIYFEHTAWKQQRVGIATNMVNPQTSKIHRHMLFRKSWETKVDRNDAAQMENFQLRVAEGLGVKTDKQTKEAALEAYAKTIANPLIKDAIAILQKRLAGADLSRSDQEALRQGVVAGGENFHSLSSLMALAQQASAKGDTFTVRLMGEVDGVTNGPMLSHLLLGAADSVDHLYSILNRGGFYEVGNEHSNYNLWRGDTAKGHFDLYETTAGHMTQAVQSLMKTGLKTKSGKIFMSGEQVKFVMGHIYAFTGTLVEDGRVTKDGRNIIKTPLTAMVFGSSVKKAVDSMANGFIESIYAGIEDVAQKDQHREALIESINVLLSQGKGPMLRTSMTVKELMEHEFSEAQLKALKKIFKDTVGTAVAETMESDFASYIEQRKQLTTAAQLAFSLHNAVYTGLHDQLVAELVAKGEIAVNAKTGKPLHDLTQAQEGELRKRLAKMVPVMETLFSKESGSLKAGLEIAKSGRKLSDKSTFEGTARFATPFADNGAKTTGTRGYEVVATPPGVATVPMSVHSTDSAISHHAADGHEVLNIHDAHGTGLSGFQSTAERLNKATFDAMLSYSPAAEMQAALSRTVVGLAALIQEGNLPPAVMTNLKAELQKIANKEELESADVIRLMLTGMKESAFKADDMKLQALEKLQSIDQYALEGGNYEVTEKNRADASALRAGLTRDLSEKEKEAIAAIESALKSTEKATSSPQERPLEEDPPKAKLPFGPVGKPAIASDPVLVSWFEANPKPTIEQVIRQLNKMIPDGFNKQLLRLLNKTLNKDLSFQWITPETTEADVIAPPGDAARGWFVTNVDGKEQINVLSPAFTNSGVTLEVVLHEMVHGALWQVVERELTNLERNPDDPSEATALVKELEELRTKATAYAKQNGLEGTFKAPLSNMQEFLAWGMTNERFQEMVLKQISMPSKTKGNPLVNGMKAFIATLTKLLFRGASNEQAENGMTVLISNVSGLFNEVGSSEFTKGRGANVNLSMATDPVGTLNTYSTINIHDALNAGDVTPEFDGHLRNLLGGIVQKLHGPYGSLKAELMKNQALTPFDVWQKALDTGVLPFASSVQASPLLVSQREGFAMDQVEATMRAVLENAENTTTSVYRDLVKLYKEASEIVKPSDFATQAEYDYVFNITLNAEGKSNHLARFTAFGLAHQKVNSLLKQDTSRDTRRARDGKTLIDKLMVLFEQVLEFFHDLSTRTYGGQHADEKLNTLVSKLVDIEAKKRMTLAKQAAGLNVGDYMNLAAYRVASVVGKGMDGGAGGAIVGAGKAIMMTAANTKFVKNSRFPIVRAAGTLLKISATGRVSQLMDNITGFRDSMFKEKHGFAMDMMNEVRGPGQVNNTLALASTHQQQQRRHVITNTAAYVLNSFANGGRDLTKAGKTAITQVFMRTGMHSLMGHFNMSEIEQLVSNKPARDAAIKKLEQELKAIDGASIFAEHFINKANALAFFKMTAEARDEKLMQSAHNISRLYGTTYQSQITEAQANAAKAIIEQLIPLYAIGYADGFVLDSAKNVIVSENARTDGQGNGIEFVLALHKRLEQEAREKLFAGQEALMTHGYTPEIYNPNTDVKTVDAAEGAELEWQGYTKVSQVALDPADPERVQKSLYVLRDGGLSPYLSGIISMTGKNAKGTKKHSGYMNVNTADGLLNAATQASIAAGKSTGLLSGPRVDLSKGAAGATYMVPIVNARGEVMNWRYMMRDSTKDTVMERDNRFDKVLGMLAGSIYDKSTVTELNTKALEALKTEYDTNKGMKEDSFLMVGPKNEDPEVRAIWSMLPDDTKTQARRIFGRDGIFVRKEAMTVMFGYRKYSLAEMFKKDPEVRGHIEKLIVAFVENTLKLYAKGNQKFRGWTPEQVQNYARRAAVKVTAAERGWQELMQEAKSNIVVKSVTVLLGNVYSNVSLLAMYGVNPVQGLRSHLVAYRGATSYHDDNALLGELQARLDTGTTNGKEAEVRSEIARLKDAIARNPVKKLMDAGLMPTIAEDVVSDDDIYSYKSELVRKTDKITSHINPTVLNVAKNIYMTQDTKPYQTLRRLTQLSDFMSRYAMYEHVTTRKQNPLSHEDAVFLASEAFINYDMPMPKGMQFMDDMGFTMFTKYFLRIQRVIVRMFNDNPGRVLMSLALNHFVNLGPTVLEQDWMSHFGNDPFRSGALQLPGTLGHIYPIDHALGLIGHGATAASTYPGQ